MIRVVAGMLFAFLIAFAITPIVRKISIRVGAIDVPKDDRRMHSKPVPTMGGVAIFVAFAFGVLAFVPLDKTYFAMLAGCLFITLVGMLDDIFGLKWWMKLLGQVGAALVVAMNGILITGFSENTPGAFTFGQWSLLITVVWIVAITNAVNLIDGLDGLACGIVGISCVSLMVVFSFYMDPVNQSIMIVIAILAGGCFGFLPYNMNPAKIFMGDTGAMLIGYTFSVISIQGFFKLNALFTFFIPFLVFALPILDTLFAIIRRLVKKQHIFKADKKHLHHRLIGWGFNQKQSVLLLYVISAMLGVAAIILAKARESSATSYLYVWGIVVLIGALAVGLITINIKAAKTKKLEEDAGSDNGNNKEP